MRSPASRANHLRALAGLQLDVVHRRTGGNVAQWKRVAHQDVGVRPADDLLSNLQSHGLQDVTLLAICVRQQRDARRTIGIVFNRRYRRGNTILIALEVDDANLALVSSATMPARQIAGIAAAARAQLDLGQRLVRTIGRDLVVDQRRLKS